MYCHIKHLFLRKQGRIHGYQSRGWAGAIFEVTRPFGQEQGGQSNKMFKKWSVSDRTTDQPTNQPTDQPTDRRSFKKCYCLNASYRRIILVLSLGNSPSSSKIKSLRQVPWFPTAKLVWSAGNKKESKAAVAMRHQTETAAAAWSQIFGAAFNCKQ